ncbi:MAG: FIST C-terminal domain-containing protein [Gammaproteobacteria bacterium]|nr:FIST C-terminal domain-containing protein [Gammaproteobacteria bacterium]
MSHGARHAATGLSHGHRALPEHAEKAVKRALAKAGRERANAVLLFLTPEYAANPEPALRAAARAGGCLQVAGCTGAGIMTEEEWILDSPGAAAMVLSGDIQLTISPQTIRSDENIVLSLCTPAGLTAGWLDVPARRFGAVSGDVFGHGPFKVWSGARVSDSEQVDAVLSGVNGVLGASQGVRALTSPIEVAEVRGYDIKRLGNYPALSVLVQSLPPAVREMERVPLHLIMGGVTIGDPETAIREGRYRLNHIVAANPNDQSITLSERPARGERIFWAMRDALAAERDMRNCITRSAQELGAEPDFALLFPCMGRGPNFFGNRDRDLDSLRSHFPCLPIIGMYGNGEIGPLDGVNHLYQYSAVLGLFKAEAA